MLKSEQNVYFFGAFHSENHCNKLLSRTNKSNKIFQKRSSKHVHILCFMFRLYFAITVVIFIVICL